MKIIIIGAYAIGTHLARLLSRNNDDITIIDDDGERLAQIGSDFDLMTMEASPSGFLNAIADIFQCPLPSRTFAPSLMKWA